MKTSILIVLGWVFLPIVSGAQQNIFGSITHQGFQRQYIIHLPPGHTISNSEPVVIVLHGGSGNYLSVQGFTQMNLVSNQNGFLAVYPQGQGVAPPGFSWADGRGTTADAANIDDVGFIAKLIDTLAADYNIDTNSVYVCGFSNGGFMTQRLACEIPEKFAAVGALGCSMDTSLIQTCHPSKALPMAYFSGTADPEVPYTGGAMRNPAVTPIVPVDTAVQFWVDHNHCQTAAPVVQLPDIVQADHSTVEFYQYTDCDCEADVYFYKIINGGHTWPGVPVSQFPQLGNTNEDIHASFELWDFFKTRTACDNVTGINEHAEEGSLRVYPNPTQDILQVESKIQVRRITLYDYTGRKIFAQQSEEINLRPLPAGMYLLFIELENGKATVIKVTKQ